MSKISTNNTEELLGAMTRFLDKFPGEIICARQIWYEGLGGCGVPTPADMDAIHVIFNSLEKWKLVGNVRYEKYGMQYSFKLVK